MIYISGRIDVENFERYRSQFMGAEEYMKETSRMYSLAGGCDDVLNLYTVLLNFFCDVTRDVPAAYGIRMVFACGIP